MATERRNPTKGNGGCVRWIWAHSTYQGDECLMWPFNKVRNGYGLFGHLGKMRYAHRFMCELVNGPPPSPTHHASHSCGHGMQGCVNPKHLEWKTPRDNHLDRKRHGTATTNRYGHAGALKPAQVLQIRSMKGKATNMALAAEHGVSVDTIRRVFTGETYRDI